MSIKIKTAGRTHVGLVRERNGDSLYLGSALLAVADGLGGHVAGDVASRTVVDVLRAHDHAVASAALPDALGRAVADANDALRRRTTAEPELAGMGTALVALLWSGTAAVLANVGDSRAYRTREGRTRQITEDHVYGRLVAAAARVPNLPERLSRFLDGRPDGRSPDLTPLQLQAGDRFLLCSDGLSSFVPHEQIHAVLDSAGDPDEAAERFVAAALDEGGGDNISVIVVDAR